MYYLPYIVLPPVPPPPPPDPPSPPREIHIDPVLDTPEEIAKWIASRKRNFPSKKNVIKKEMKEKEKEERGDLSKFELRMRKRLALIRKINKREEERQGQNPFLKYMSLRKKLLNNQILTEQRLLLQCIRYCVKHNFLQE
ncbi:unnamed protein product [Blepharisma stoltei]|uniref:FMR1-interacting protein 1 conserved domain-containing protein n=1 Tax=Blepharisma stoltei TaxID=1481888 RepID=A0AAU9JPA5_9CILI|nr:unnamed protein product [Blepharisma stoltei]